MKTFQSSKAVSRIATLTAAVAAGLVLVPSLASAAPGTAANTTVRNIVYVDYADASAVAQPQISAEVDVVVQLVAATPTLNAPVDQTIAPSSTAAYSYTVYSNANGPDTYNLATSVGTENNLSGSTASTSVASVTLGATSVAVAPGAIAADTPTFIVVPSDSAIDAEVNGIVTGDVVAIGGVRCDVTDIVDSGTALTGAITNSQIEVDCDAAINPAVSAIIGEQQSFTMTVDPNGWTAPANGDVTVTTSAGDAADLAADDTDDTLTTVEQLLTVTKYVRNDTTPVVGGGLTITIDGNDYYTTGVTGVPGDTLEYLIAIENTSTTNNATDTVISDSIPAFTTFNATNFAVIDDAGTATAADPTANDGDEGELVGTTVYLYPGSTTHGDDDDGGTGNANGDGGTIDASSFAYGRFQVDID